MSKDRKKTIQVPVETVENLIESFEWIITSINFWKIDKTYPTNLILKVAADFYYEFRKLRTDSIIKSKKK